MPSSGPKIILSLLIIMLAALIFTANIQFVFRPQFLGLKDNIEQNLSRALGKNFSAQEINFSLYGRLKLIRVKITDENSLTYATIKEVEINFSSLLLLLGKTFFINGITLVEPEIFPPAKGLKINLPPPGLSGRYQLGVSRRLAVVAKSGKIVLDENIFGREGRKIDFDFWARLEENRKIYSQGRALYQSGTGRADLFFPEPFKRVKYTLRATCFKQNFSIEELLLDFGQFKIQGTGAVKNYNTDNPILDLKIGLKEFNFLEESRLKAKFFVSNILNLILQVKGEFKQPRWSLRLDKLRTKFPYLPRAVEIDNFYSNLRLSKDEFILEDLACFINGFPVGLRGKVSDFKNPGLELSLISYPGQISTLRDFNPLNFMFNFSGYKEGNSFKGAFSMKLDTLISRNPKKIHTLKLAAAQVWCKLPDVSADNSLWVEAKNIISENNRFGPDAKFEFSDFSSSVFIKGDIAALSDLSLRGYEGALRGIGFIDFKKLPPVFFLNFEGDGFNLAKLVEVFKLDYDLAGEIATKGIVNTRSDPFIISETSVSQGHIKNMKLLEMLSDFLNTPSIKNIYFDDFSSKFSFSYNEPIVSLDEVKLRGKDVYIDANLKFSQRQNLPEGSQAIEGDVLVRLSKAVLKESFKLRLLFALVKDKLPYTDFEFKIGGLATAPHIQWLEGKLRSYIMRYVSKEGRQQIEKQLDEALKPLIKNK